MEEIRTAVKRKFGHLEKEKLKLAFDTLNRARTRMTIVHRANYGV